MSYLKFENLSKFPEISHFVSTRKTKKIPFKNFALVNQVHGNEVLLVNKKVEDISADAMATNKKDIGLVIRVADCVPILFFDPSKKVVGVAHAGWRGTLKKISSKTLQKMQEEFGSNPKDTVVGIGPCICVKHYEVGEAVLPGARGNFDLRMANKLQLLEEGVLAQNIEIMPYCTYERTDLFYSYRGKKETGRFLVGISIA